MKRKIIKTITVISMISLLVISSTAQLYAANAYNLSNYSESNNSAATYSRSTEVNVRVRFSDENKPSIDGKLISNTTYVALRGFLNSIGGFNITWNQKNKSASAISEEFDIFAQIGKYELIVNNNTVQTIAENKLINNITYVPIRPLAEAMGYDVKWNGISKTVTLSETANNEIGGVDTENFGTYGSYTAKADSHYNADDLYWLSRIISAESRGESIEGKLAVGSVVMNRTEHRSYPDTIKDVVFDDKYGIQFTPVANGSVYYQPTEESIFAAKIILEGYRMNNEIIYFVDTKASPNSWVELNNTFLFKIGCHSFFK